MDPLSQIAKKYQTDKYGHHNFTQIYFDWLKHLDNEPITLLELGVGGYEFSDRGGGSLKMWRDFLPKAKIVGVDLYDKSEVYIPEVEIIQGSQLDEEFLHSLIKRIGAPDVIIDDASHINNYTIKTFDILFPLLKSGGVYFVEDAHTSYWSENYNGDEDHQNNHTLTVMNYFHSVTHSLNREHIRKPLPNYGDIKGVHFYKEMVVIEKL